MGIFSNKGMTWKEADMVYFFGLLERLPAEMCQVSGWRDGQIQEKVYFLDSQKAACRQGLILSEKVNHGEKESWREGGYTTTLFHFLRG